MYMCIYIYVYMHKLEHMHMYNLEHLVRALFLVVKESGGKRCACPSPKSSQRGFKAYRV